MRLTADERRYRTEYRAMVQTSLKREFGRGAALARLAGTSRTSVSSWLNGNGIAAVDKVVDEYMMSIEGDAWRKKVKQLIARLGRS